MNRKKLIALIVAMLMVFTCMPSMAYAEDATGETTIVDSGTCGDDLTWEFDSEGVLTISGTGDMYGYDYGGCSQPWYGFSITSLIIEEGVTKIGDFAFQYCSCSDNLTIPDSVTEIGAYAFSGSSFTGQLVIPESVTKIGGNAFGGCNGFIGNLVLSDNIVDLGHSAFYNCSGFNGTLTLPKNITRIEDYTFYNCSGFTGDLVIPDSVKTIGYSAFYNCSGFNGTLTLPKNITRIENYTFYNCSGFTGDLVIPDSVKTIGNSAFQYCSGFTGNLIISDSVTSIGQNSFWGCSGFTGDLIIPDSVKTIGDSAFKECSGLNGDLIISNSVTEINSPFYDCNFENIYIPDSVIKIGYGSFSKNNYSKSRQFYVFKGSYADKNNGSFIHENDSLNYISKKTQGQKDYLAFKTSTIIAGATDDSESVELARLLISNKEITLGDDNVIISDPSIAAYSNGYIIGIFEGECNITVTIGDQECTAKLVVTNDEIPTATSFSFAEESIMMDRGTTAYNQIVKDPEGADITVDRWSSSDTDVATVDENGIVTAVSPGTTKITAKSGNISASYEVEVGSVYIGVYTLYPTDEHEMVKGEKEALRYYIYPFDTTDDSEVAFESSDKDVVTVTDDGLMEAVGVGTASIKVKKGDVEDSVTVTVNNPIKSIGLDKTSFRAYVQDEVQLNLTYDPADHNDDVTASWTSSDETIATVDNNGLVTITGTGIATITAEVKGLTSSCKVTALPMVALESIALDNEAKTIKYNEEFAFTVTKTPKNTTNKKPVLWASSDEDVVTVSEDGSIKGVGVGTANITATVKDTKDANGQPITATCAVTVEKATPEYTVPEGLVALAGNTLSDIELPEGFTWNDETADVGERGEKSFKATFTPEDTDNYETINDIDIPIKVLDPKVTAINLQKTLELCVDRDFILEATIETQDDPEYTVTWSVDDADIAEVEQNGKVTAKAAGETTVTVKTSEEVAASCKVIVNNHDYDAVVTAPTCTKGGFTTYTCTACNDEYVADETESLGGHDEVSHEAQAPTCTEIGWDAYVTCSRCDYTTYDEKAKLGHDEVSHEGKTPTCTEPGWDAYVTCKRDGCDYSTYHALNASGHAFNSYIINDDGTCIKNATKTSLCDNGCGTTDTRIAEGVFGSCKYGDWETVKEATSTQDGLQKRSCTWCGNTQTTTIAAKGVEINEENFPDPEFRRALINHYTQDEDGDDTILTPAELKEFDSFYNNSDEYAIKDLTGIHLLTSLTYLDTAYSTLIKHIPLLPDSLEEIRCDEASVASFEMLPASLIRLSVQGGALKSLPELPEGLEDLWISQNKLTSLPKLPKSLRTLSCWDNQLTELPELPEGLEELNCDENKLKDIPKLPNGLKEFSCTYNELTSLQDLPDTVIWFRCYDNQLTKLPKLSQNLTELYAGYNNISGALDVSDLEYLSILEVQGNVLTAVKLCEDAPYKEILLYDNAIKSLSDVTGGSDMPWDEDYDFQFKDQTKLCKVYGHSYEVISETAATCTKAGRIETECSVCGDWVTKITTATGHDMTYHAAVEAGCENAGNISYYTCDVCKGYFLDQAGDTATTAEKVVVAALDHNYGAYKTTTKAKFGKNGVQKSTCSGCDKYKTKPIYAPKTIKLSATSYTYNGKAKKPSVIVYDSKGKKISSSNYKVSYSSGCKSVGTYKATVTFKKSSANYTKSKSAIFKINPARKSISKITPSKKAFTVKWSKPSSTYRKQMSGYQIQYSTSSKMTKAKKVTVKGTSATSKSIKKLKAKKTYYVQLRTYKKIGSTYYYSKWSKTIKVKTK